MLSLAALSFVNVIKVAAQSRQPGTVMVRKNTSEIQKSAPASEVAAKLALSPEVLPPASRTSASLVRADFSGWPSEPKVTLTLSSRIALSTFILADPYRIVIEGEGLTFSENLTLTLPPDGSLIDYRYGQLESGRGRLVVESLRPVRLTDFYSEPDGTIDGKKRSVIRLTPATREAVLKLKDQAPLTLAALADEQGAVAPIPAAPVTAQSVRPIIIIDPGHGGRDPGAVAAGGALEKDVVLAVGQRLKLILSASGRYDLRMTRETDVSVPLATRVATSTAAHASLFISIHADTFTGLPLATAVRGGSVYILSDKASNQTAQMLADKENTADARSGLETGKETGDAAVNDFLSDLMFRETQTFAAHFQNILVQKLRGAITLAREPARAASFQVLKQPGAPAVLVELGYMSHAQDIALLQSPDWQNQVANAIARAVDAYFASPRRVVGQQ